MPIAISIPRLGWNMDEGVFAGWLKQDGDVVRPGDPLFTLEGEKATQDIEAIDPGILRIPASSPRAGDRVAVGTVIGYLIGPGESDPVVASGAAPAQANAVASVARSAPEGRSKATSVVEQASAQPSVGIRGDRPRISPLARRIARELGVDWSSLRGSGRTGRIRKVDILDAARTGRANGTAAQARSVPISAIRRTIAGRLLESQRTTVPVTLTTSVDATNLVNLRAQYKAAAAEGRAIPGYTDFAVKLTALALREHPLLNARWEGDHILVPDDIHIGIAVDTDAGLVVPVIQGVPGLGLTAIAARVREFSERARSQRLQPADLQGGTFTITNLGAFGIETFTPVINPPECAILGLGRIERRAVMAGDQVVGRERMSLSLTFDHRIVDGAPAARFLQRLGQLIENPGPWLIS